MTEEKKKRFDHYPTYWKLSEEQQQEFKKALFLTKGAVNNDVGCMLALLGLNAKDIAKYGTPWEGVDGVMSGTLDKHHRPFKTGEKALMRKIKQQAKRIPDLFDTIRGRVLVAKHGDEIKDEFCDKDGKCSLNVVCIDDTYDKVLDSIEPSKSHSEEWWAFTSVRSAFTREQNLDFNREKASRLEFLESTKASEVALAKSKGIDLGALYERATSRRSDRPKNGDDGLDKYPELQKDFWGFLKQDLSSLAHAPMESLRRELRLEEGKFATLFSISTEIGRQLVGNPYDSENVYSASPNAPYNSLYIRGLYQAMDEMGVGIATSSQMAYPRGHFNTRVKKIAHKVISLNEKYQRMLKNKSNKIEPAILRETLVSMFNEFADRSGFEFRMFVREDRPAPTLAELHPKKQPKSTKTTTSGASKKRLTGPKEIVICAEGTFTEY